MLALMISKQHTGDISEVVCVQRQLDPGHPDPDIWWPWASVSQQPGHGTS